MNHAERYHRQTLLPGVGQAGQHRLSQGHALIVGCGALGCTAADLLARAGVGTITIVDRDVVELTNLQRQTLFDEDDARRAVPKAVAAAARLARANSQIRILGDCADFSGANADSYFATGPEAARTGQPADSGRGPARPGVIIDGTDNFSTRFLLNDVAVKYSVPLVYAGVVGAEAMSATLVPGVTPCLRCLFDAPPPPGSTPTCDTAGVLGPAAAIAAACEAADALKVLLGRADLLSHTLLHFDLWSNLRRRIALPPSARQPDCPCCVQRTFEYLAARDAAPAVMCGRNAIQLSPPPGSARPDLPRAAAALEPVADVTLSEYLLRASMHDEPADTAGTLELTLFADGRLTVRGTSRPERARQLAGRYLGW